MGDMFYGASAFNQGIGGWDTSGVGSMGNMFRDATAFDQDIGGWDVTGLYDATDMFEGVKLSTENYDALLIGWGAQALQSGVVFSGGNSNFCKGAAARELMISTLGWTITDGGMVCQLYLP
jgi:hypothetical protein